MNPAKDFRHPVRIGSGMLFASALLCAAAPASARNLLESTYLLDIRQGTRLSDEVARLGRGGYELSGGAYVDFRRWYSPKWTEMRIDFMTQLSEGVGIIWGVSTGEWGRKYRIAPGFKVGMILQAKTSPRSTLSLSFSMILGGRLREKTCDAYYGITESWETVNCRLAASPLPPSETLKHLVRMRPPDWGWVGVRYEARF